MLTIQNVQKLTLCILLELRQPTVQQFSECCLGACLELFASQLVCDVQWKAQTVTAVKEKSRKAKKCVASLKLRVKYSK